MGKVGGFMMATVSIFVGLFCVMCGLFSGGDIDPAERASALYVTVTMKVAIFMAAGFFILVGLLIAVMSLRIKERPSGTSVRLRLARYYLESKRKKPE
jgi:hypothetical protein